MLDYKGGPMTGDCDSGYKPLISLEIVIVNSIHHSTSHVFSVPVSEFLPGNLFSANRRRYHLNTGNLPPDVR